MSGKAKSKIRQALEYLELSIKKPHSSESAALMSLLELVVSRIEAEDSIIQNKVEYCFASIKYKVDLLSAYTDTVNILIESYDKSRNNVSRLELENSLLEQDIKQREKTLIKYQRLNDKYIKLLSKIGKNKT